MLVFGVVHFRSGEDRLGARGWQCEGGVDCAVIVLLAAYVILLQEVVRVLGLEPSESNNRSTAINKCWMRHKTFFSLKS
jgi:hypothetical protein